MDDEDIYADTARLARAVRERWISPTAQGVLRRVIEAVQSGSPWQIGPDELPYSSHVWSGRDLRGAPLDHMDFTGRDLSNVTLDFASLKGAALSKADLRGATLNHVVLSGAEARHIKLDECFVQNARCIRTDFTGASMVGTVLAGSDLRGSIFRGADLRDAVLLDTRLDETDFALAQLAGSRFSVKTWGSDGPAAAAADDGAGEG